jgi:hypothetical protein
MEFQSNTRTRPVFNFYPGWKMRYQKSPSRSKRSLLRTFSIIVNRGKRQLISLGKIHIIRDIVYVVSYLDTPFRLGMGLVWNFYRERHISRHQGRYQLLLLGGSVNPKISNGVSECWRGCCNPSPESIPWSRRCDGKREFGGRDIRRAR